MVPNHGLEAGDIIDDELGEAKTVREVSEEGHVFWEDESVGGESAEQVAARLESGRYEKR